MFWLAMMDLSSWFLFGERLFTKGSCALQVPIVHDHSDEWTSRRYGYRMAVCILRT